jgi:GNAT superfamily N-acetyltransferase
MSLPYSFRKANEDDIELVIELHRTTLKEYVEVIWGWDEELQQKLIRERFNPASLQVIQVTSIDIGVLNVEKRKEEWHLANIQLQPEFQKKGLGTQILTDLISKADQNRVPLTLSVLAPNPARLLYERLGFVTFEQDEKRFHMRRKPS